MNGNWATLYMTRDLGRERGAGLAGADGLLGDGDGRPRPVRRHRAVVPRAARPIGCLPFVIAAALRRHRAACRAASPWLGLLAFGLAGLGCSALLPLTISFGQEELTAIAASVAGGLIAFYQMGYGIAAFGVGPLQERAGLGLDHASSAVTAVRRARDGGSVPSSSPRRPTSAPDGARLPTFADRSELDPTKENTS